MKEEETEALYEAVKEKVDERKHDGVHYHRDKSGILHRCYHRTRFMLTDWAFWVGLTLGFPVEHAIWEKIWPFYELTHLLGL